MVVLNECISEKTGDKDFEVALIDLGHAQELSGGQEYLIASREGTVLFQAPEQMESQRSLIAGDFMHPAKAGLKTDIYALGSTILFVMSGILPWLSGGIGMSKQQYTKRDEICRHMEKIIRNNRYDDLHVSAMHVDPTSTWSDDHKKMAKPMPYLVITLIKQMLNVIIGARPSAKEVVQQLNAAVALALWAEKHSLPYALRVYPYF